MKQKPELCDAQIKLRLPRSLLDAVELAAAADRWKARQFLRNVIEDALAQRTEHDRARRYRAAAASIGARAPPWPAIATAMTTRRLDAMPFCDPAPYSAERFTR